MTTHTFTTQRFCVNPIFIFLVSLDTHQDLHAMGHRCMQAHIALAKLVPQYRVVMIWIFNLHKRRRQTSKRNVE